MSCDCQNEQVIQFPTPTYASLSFTTIQTTSGTNPVADSASDTLTVSAGAGITVTGDSATDTVTIASTITQYTDEMAQDAVGTILTDSSTIDFTYSDATPSITAGIITASVSNSLLANMAQATIKGRASGAGTGAPTDLTAAQVAAIVNSSLDHGTLLGLTDDDHTQYLLAAGTRVLTGNWLTSAAALEVQFRATTQRIYSSATSTLDLDANTTTNFRIGTNLEAVLTNDYLTFQNSGDNWKLSWAGAGLVITADSSNYLDPIDYFTFSESVGGLLTGAKLTFTGGDTDIPASIECGYIEGFAELSALTSYMTFAGRSRSQFYLLNGDSAYSEFMRLELDTTGAVNRAKLSFNSYDTGTNVTAQGGYIRASSALSNSLTVAASGTLQFFIGAGEVERITSSLHYLTSSMSMVVGGTSSISGAKLSVDGSADVIQFAVQSHSTQTSSLILYENSAGTDLWTFSNSGNALWATAGEAQFRATGNRVYSSAADTLDVQGNTTLNLGKDAGDIALFGSTLRAIKPAQNEKASLGTSSLRFFDIFMGGSIDIESGNIITDTTTGMQIATGSTQKISLWGATPVARFSAWTQTYSTTSKTTAALTSSAVSTTAATNIGPFGYTTQAQADAIVAAINALRTDVSNVKNNFNSLLDDLQTWGFTT